MLIVREEFSTLTTGTTEWIWSPTSPRLGWLCSGSRWTIICKSLKQLLMSNLKEELVSWEQNIQFHTFIQISGLWGEDTCKKRWTWKFFVKIISNERPGRVSRCSYQTSILFWRSSFSWRSQWANIYFFYNWSSSLCHSSFKVHMLSLTASRTNFVILFYSIKMKIFSLLYGYNIV